MTYAQQEARYAAELLATRTPEELEDPDFVEALLQGETQIEEVGAKLIARMDRAQIRVQSLKAERELIDAQIARWERYTEAQKRAGMEMLDIVGLPNIKTPRGTLYRKAGNQVVVITDLSQVPENLKKAPEPPAPVPDKRAIAQSWKKGVPVPGTGLSNGAPTLAIKR